MRLKIYPVIILCFFLLSNCGNNEKKNSDELINSLEQKKKIEFDKLVSDILNSSSYFYIGGCQVGNLTGESYIKINGEEKKVSVNYSIDFGNGSQSTTESGALENISLSKDGNGNYILSADWKNLDPSLGSGKFSLSITDLKKKQLGCKITGSTWSYWGFFNLDNEAFNKTMNLFSQQLNNSVNEINFIDSIIKIQYSFINSGREQKKIKIIINEKDIPKEFPMIYEFLESFKLDEKYYSQDSNPPYEKFINWDLSKLETQISNNGVLINIKNNLNDEGDYSKLFSKDEVTSELRSRTGKVFDAFEYISFLYSCPGAYKNTRYADTPIFEKDGNETIVSIANQIELTFENSSTNCKIKKIEYSLDGC